MAAFRKALESPGNAFSLANLGFAIFQMGQVDDAMRLYREALRLQPGYADAHYYYGNALQSLGRLEEATEHYRLALAISPLDAAVHYNLGLALEGLGRSSEAAAHYREAIRLRPGLLQGARLARVTRVPLTAPTRGRLLGRRLLRQPLWPEKGPLQGRFSRWSWSLSAHEAGTGRAAKGDDNRRISPAS